MEKEIANVCPICGERNPATNEICYKCGYKFIEQKKLYLMVEDKTTVIALLEDSIKFFREALIYLHNVEGDIEIHDAKISRTEALQRINAILPYFNNTLLFNKYSADLLKSPIVPDDFEDFLMTFGIGIEELYFSNNEAMNVDERRRRTLTRAGSFCFALIKIKNLINEGKIVYLDIKSEKDYLKIISEEISKLK